MGISRKKGALIQQTIVTNPHFGGGFSGFRVQALRFRVQGLGFCRATVNISYTTYWAWVPC